jgi:MFS family permease
VGRRGTILISAVFCLLTPIGGAITRSWQQLFITRILMGIGMGLKGATVPIFAAENSPAAIRGALVMSWQMVCEAHYGSFVRYMSMDTNRRLTVDCFWHFSRLLC